MIVAADIHFMDWPEFAYALDGDGMTDRLKQTLDQVEWIFKYAESVYENYVVIAGDFYHRWNAVDTVVGSLVSTALYRILEETGIHLIISPGNHDMNNRRSCATMTIDSLAGHPSITVLSEPCLLDVDGMATAFVPYNRDFPWVVDQLTEWRKRGARLAITHIDILKAEAKIHGYHAVKGIPIEAFTGYDLSVSGHYHMPQDMPLGDRVVQYVGSPLHTHFDDAGQVKRILRVNNYQSVSIPTPWRAEFVVTDQIKPFASPEGTARYTTLKCRHDQYDELYAYYKPRSNAILFQATDLDQSSHTFYSIPEIPPSGYDPTLVFTALFPELDQATLLGMIYKYVGEVQ